LREETEKDHQYFMSDLEIFDLLNPTTPFSLDKYLNLQMLIKMLSRNKRSVQTARTLMNIIFTVREVELLAGEPTRQLDCIASKFKVLHDLSITLKVPI